MRSPISSGSSARMKIPFSCKSYPVRATCSESDRVQNGIELDRRALWFDQLVVDPAIRMRVCVFHDLEPDDSTDRCACDYITRPVHVVVHTRKANHSGATVKHRSDPKPGVWPPKLRFPRQR